MSVKTIEPDYDSYDISELIDARDHIDQLRFPDRYHKILDHLRRRGDGSRTGEPSTAEGVAAAASAAKSGPGFWRPRNQVILAVIAIGLLIGGSLTFLAAGKIAQVGISVVAVQTEMNKMHQDETIRLDVKPAGEGVQVRIIFTDSELADLDEDRKQRIARRSAQKAWETLDGSLPVTSIAIVFESTDDAVDEGDPRFRRRRLADEDDWCSPRAAVSWPAAFRR